jgi:hypothetical protein
MMPNRIGQQSGTYIAIDEDGCSPATTIFQHTRERRVLYLDKGRQRDVLDKKREHKEQILVCRNMLKAMSADTKVTGPNVSNAPIKPHAFSMQPKDLPPINSKVVPDRLCFLWE